MYSHTSSHTRSTALAAFTACSPKSVKLAGYQAPHLIAAARASALGGRDSGNGGSDSGSRQLAVYLPTIAAAAATVVVWLKSRDYGDDLRSVPSAGEAGSLQGRPPASWAVEKSAVAQKTWGVSTAGEGVWPPPTSSDGSQKPLVNILDLLDTRKYTNPGGLVDLLITRVSLSHPKPFDPENTQILLAWCV